MTRWTVTVMLVRQSCARGTWMTNCKRKAVETPKMAMMTSRASVCSKMSEWMVNGDDGGSG